MRRHPHLLEIPALPWLRRLSEDLERDLTLAAVPDEEWASIARAGFDVVWLMGVWHRSPQARRIAIALPELRERYDVVLPGWTGADIAGSPYAVYDYGLDPQLGEGEELADVRARLRRHGLRLVVDFVPNHLAIDHPWVAEHPERLVRVDAAAALRHPEFFFQAPPGGWFGYGRDPNFGPWIDTVQVNFFAPELREAYRETLLGIAREADGVRCDMTMLAMNDVFQRSWGEFVTTPRPAEEFWPPLVRAVKRAAPDFLFMAEVYWGLEPAARAQGFDFTYDKTLYDRLRDGDAPAIRAAIAGSDAPSCEVRFVENHDEPRAAAVFGREKSWAAATVVMTLPGLRFVQEGQAEGRRSHAPVQLGRAPREEADPEFEAFYRRLFEACADPVMHQGEWALLEVAGPVLAWCWTHEREERIVLVNWSDREAPVRVQAAGELRDALGGLASAAGSEGQWRSLTLRPWQPVILRAAASAAR